MPQPECAIRKLALILGLYILFLKLDLFKGLMHSL